MGTPTGRFFQPLIPPVGQMLLSTMVLCELSKWLSRNRGPQAADEVMVTLLAAHVVEPTVNIALQAAELSCQAGPDD